MSHLYRLASFTLPASTLPASTLPVTLPGTLPPGTAPNTASSVSIPLVIREGTYDADMVYVVACANEYSLPPTLSGVVLDIGAHIGTFSLACAIRGATVFGYEAHPENASLYATTAMLARSSAGVPGKIIPAHCAVGPDNVAFSVYMPHTFPSDQRGLVNTGGLGVWEGDPREADETKEYWVRAYFFDTIHQAPPILPLDTYTPPFSWNDVTLVKFDIEGYEFPILRTSKRIASILWVIGEYHLGSYASEVTTHDAVEPWLRRHVPTHDVVLRYHPSNAVGQFFLFHPSTPYPTVAS